MEEFNYSRLSASFQDPIVINTKSCLHGSHALTGGHHRTKLNSIDWVLGQDENSSKAGNVFLKMHKGMAL